MPNVNDCPLALSPFPRPVAIRYMTEAMLVMLLLESTPSALPHNNARSVTPSCSAIPQSMLAPVPFMRSEWREDPRLARKQAQRERRASQLESRALAEYKAGI